MFRHDQPAAQVLLWEPEARRKVGRSRTTLNSVVLERETGLPGDLLWTAMLDLRAWHAISHQVNGAFRMTDSLTDCKFMAPTKTPLFRVFHALHFGNNL